MTETPLHTVLIIDDEEMILSSLKRLLRQEFLVLTAASGEEGLAVMQHEEVHIILSDQRMPGMSGVDFLSNVKGQFPDAIRLLLTGYADVESVIAAINSGNIYRYLVKPWNPEELISVMREAAQRYDLIVQNRRLLKELVAANELLEERVRARTAELHEANQRLSELNRMKDEFLAITSHDLRSPLGNIQTIAQMLQDASYGFSAEERKDLLVSVEECAAHLIHLVSDMLDVLKIEAGKVELECAPLYLSAVLRKSMDALGFNARAKQITLELQDEPDEPVLQADELKLYQVFNNLLSNAIKFTPTGGAIQLKVTRQAEQVLVSVADNGQGIPADQLAYIFDRFRQTRTRATAGEKGSGLGLTIVRQLVELHGGTVTVQSQLQQGTTFVVSLPIQPIQPVEDVLVT